MELPDSSPRIERHDKFIEVIMRWHASIWMGVGTVIAFASLLLPTGLSELTRVVLFLLFIILGAVGSYTKALRQFTLRLYTDIKRSSAREIAKLEKKLSELEGYNAFLDAKYTHPVNIMNKDIDIQIIEDGKDIVSYGFEFVPDADKNIAQFYALFGVDNHDISWSDVDISAKNAVFSDYKRRDFAEWVRFIIELKLCEKVKPGDQPYCFSLEIRADAFDPDEDIMNALVRHKTDRINYTVQLPEGWGFDRVVASMDENQAGLDSVDRDIPKAENNGDLAEWSCDSCQRGDSYVIDWDASIQNGDQANQENQTQEEIRYRSDNR